MTVHGMTEDQDHCEICYESGCVSRIPQMPSVKVVKEEAGQLVREFIEESRSDLKRDKDKLTSEEYKR
jgi:hypothetical protein